jgi:ubiquinone/menaquinone biosynthesis C-methylase UbiE
MAMPSKVTAEAEIQQRYYAESAHKYSEMHDQDRDGHYLALALLVATIDYFGIESILDIGSGTGRAVTYVKKKCPGIKIIGLEPVKELREIGYQNGLSHDELIEGDGLKLDFRDGEFDMVCEFGVLHHVRSAETVVGEMLRVAKKAVYLSDSNNFGQGSVSVRAAKQLLNFFGLWKAANFIHTRGKGYVFSEDDGLAYSYSVFNSYKQIEAKCKRIHVLNTSVGGINPYKTASQVALVGVKDQPAR